MKALIATPRARALGGALRRARLARKFGQGELARLLEIPGPDLSHWERGTRLPKVEDVSAILACLRVTGDEKQRLLDLARNAREPNWFERSYPDAPQALTAFIEYERDAAAAFAWEPMLIPGLLQTADYARAIFAYEKLKPAEVEQWLMIRLGRRDVLSGHDAMGYSLLLGEVALRQRIGGDAVMAEQLRHLLAVSQFRNLALRIVPIGEGFHPGLSGAFVIYDFADLQPIVFVEHHRGCAYIYDEQVAAYQAAAKMMTTLALSEQDSVTFIRGVLTELEVQA
ncbi:helix-turn-helix domain-containing protein [Amycolatopsis sp. H20-H5]|uniref:helix-turn-helix domain-containing protein n=1 Tax=Amycolatopsis sp. H20-H5 TaxID=3046309 RepID=UPI002DB5AB84|nr:helix-turn-helix transcriptional regulator [Amycolatopsis sp. H20-H5]MEC3978545.1 helix-turn-helix transcriptional regulator [Amycolatopsis sp. H20-H5]